MRVALLGPRGTYSEEALRRFERNAEPVLCKDIESIFDNVLSGSTEFGIVPVENSLEGSVNMTLDMLLKQDVKIYKEIVIDINHNLMALPDTDIAHIREIYSHPHALAQCKNFLKSINVRTRNFLSTADAAREIRDRNLKNTAAIAPKVAAKLYGLKILKENLQDEDFNQTRFLVISRKDHERTEDSKTSVIFSLIDKPGALHEALGIFASHDINLTKIESRPSKKALGDYVFFVDLEGHLEDTAVKDSIDELKQKTAFLKVLGSYARM